MGYFSIANTGRSVDGVLVSQNRFMPWAALCLAAILFLFSPASMWAQDMDTTQLHRCLGS
jgi:hypothetical protein